MSQGAIPGAAGAAQLERELLARWKAEDLFRATLRQAAGRPEFVFYEGPPTANGQPGMHHVLARTIKDLVCRYRSMTGWHVSRTAGWDTHGLPVEIEVEKQLGISGKTEIGEGPGTRISVEEFNRKCRESVWRYKAEWEELSDRIGFWLDYERPYVTYSAPYIESVWWLLRQLYDKGLLVRGYKVLPYCPRCGTALSSHELALGYEQTKDPSVFVLFPLAGGEERYLLIWTTTPWTLVANLAVAVHPDLDYVEVERGGRRIVVAGARAPFIVPAGDSEPLSAGPVVGRFKGRELVGLRYRRPLDVVPLPEVGERQIVLPGDFVSAEEGTGLVHLAPYGTDDYAMVQEHGLVFAQPVDPSGRFRGTSWPAIEGVFVKDADAAIMQRLKDEGLLLRRETVEHSYPFCWRCDTPLLYYARPSWFARTTAVRDRLLALNAAIAWHPPEMGTGRFGEWLQNNVDWALSRDRFWGTPLPIWICDRDEDHLEVLGSYAELAERWGGGGRALPSDFDPHKPHIDRYFWPCRRCEGTMRRTSEVLDAWFDSGAMPVAQWHYPFEHAEEFRRHFPADFIAEGVDQTRGWFYSLLAIATLVFDETAFRHVVVNELVLDAAGQKMSKSRGNVVDPWSVIEEYGADAVRLFLVSASQVWLPKRVDARGMREAAAGMLDKLRQSYHLLRLYAGDWAPSAADPAPAARPTSDRWLLSRLAATVAAVREAWDGFDVTAGARAIGAFVVDDLSNWWVRVNRSRFWMPDRPADPAALATLWETLVATARLLAPAAPFLSDWLHRALAGTSVHLAAFPEPDAAAREVELERAMDAVRRLASLARAAREEVGLRVRQPLSKLLVAIPAEVARAQFDELLPLLMAEVNVKEVELVGASRDLGRLSARPNYRSLGRRFGGATPAVAAAIRALAHEDVARLEAGGAGGSGAGGGVTIEVNGTPHLVEAEDVLVQREARGGLVVKGDAMVVAALDPTVTEDLRAEGLARELVSRVQRLRKEAGYEVTDRIELWVAGDEPVRQAARRFADYICGEVLARRLEVEDDGPDAELARELDLDGCRARLAIRRVRGGEP